MPSYVLATAGHVDHGKSALVRALTGIEPDRWEEERRRGMTIGLGYAWTVLPSGADVAFVDVPGHERFIGTMLAGVGPAPAVLFVVAADEGWAAQSEEHLQAIDAFGVGHGLLVVTKSDRADPLGVMSDARSRIGCSSLGEVDAVAVSALTGDGLPELRAAIDRLCAQLPAPNPSGGVRLWIDRSFTIRGAGTVVTGTLGDGTLRVDDLLTVQPGEAPVAVRGLQSEGRITKSLTGVRRAAVNLRAVDAGSLGRGMALVTPDAWISAATVDVVGAPSGLPLGELLGSWTVVHVGSASVRARVRPLGEQAARLRLDWRLPLHVGDRLLLRDPARRHPPVGVDIAALDPLPLRGGAAAEHRARRLAEPSTADREVADRGLVDDDFLRAAGFSDRPVVALQVGEWWCSPDRLEEWSAKAHLAIDAAADQELPVETLRRLLDIEPLLLDAVLRRTPTLKRNGSTVASASRVLVDSAALRQLLLRLAEDPFDAPDRAELAALQLSPAELSRAVSGGRLLLLAPGVYVSPDVVPLAARRLCRLEQPFTASAARAALGLTRRVAIPLLEQLDRAGITRRIDDNHRQLVGSTE